MTTNYESSLAAVRAISEGRTPARTLWTIPVQTLVLKAKPAEPFVVPIEEMAHHGRSQKLGTMSLAAAMDLFKQSNPGEFTSRQCCDFLTAAGWDGGERRIANVTMKLRAMCGKHLVNEVRRKHVGKALTIIWQFPAKKS